MSYPNKQIPRVEKTDAELPASGGANPFLTLSRRVPPSEPVTDSKEDVQNSARQTVTLDGLVAAVLQSAEAHYVRGNVATAREFLVLLNHGNRHTADSAQSLGNLHFLLGEYQEAADCYHASLQLDRRSPVAWVGLATACQHLGDEVNADTCIREALNLDHGNQAALRLDADQKLRTKRFQEAALTYRRLIGSYPDQQGVFLSLAKCFFELGDRESCEAALRYVLEIDPSNALARDNLAALSTAKPS
jgi:Flp pilus assembly protein TadD